MQKIVYFTGPLPRKGQVPFGGGEVGDVRTVRMLESLGYQVVQVRKRRSGAADSRLKSMLSYPFRALSNAAGWFFVLLAGNRKDGVAHVAGFYGTAIRLEKVLVAMAKMLGYRTVYELRGGGAQEFYENGSGRYRKRFKDTLCKADYLFSQGKENEPLLHSLCGKPVFHYPNCVQEGFYPAEPPRKPEDSVNLLYYGRIEEEKNPMLVVETAALLQKMFSNIRLTMLGNGRKDLTAKVREKMEQSLAAGSYELLPGCEHEQLKALLPDKHFYVFPSTQPREGQSNAVTEAMSYGIIPVASPQGFNSSTIGDERLIVNTLSADAYADRIASIIRAGEVGEYSRFVRQRFLENYTEKAVAARLEKEYERIFNG